ncbi:hypothetical protein M514_07128 [Trichuris suis]|uniref:Uncharacterized protein n=1 Tax=Trichuris suis TaxID=68888 RepID=A0A085NPJ1_9BILA|nr:hypothetical protein M514_16319 [Trichuris suis]KFD71389.1 hypothetical protein M514_07128 [Trichuris suis]
MDYNIMNSSATASGGDSLAASNWQVAPTSNEAPKINGNPLVNTAQVGTVYCNHQICRNMHAYNSAVPFVPNSSVDYCNGVAYRAVSPPQENISDHWRSHPVWFPQVSNVRVPVVSRRQPPARNYVYNYGRTAVKRELADVAMSTPSMLLNRTGGTDSVTTVLANSQQVGNLSNGNLNSNPTNCRIQYGSLTPDGRHMICRSCGCCTPLPDGTFSKFVQHLKMHCFVQPKAKNYRAPSMAPKFNPTAPFCAPVTLASIATNNNGQNVAPAVKRIKTEPTVGQLNWTRYAIYTGIGESVICRLCGPESFPFYCIDGFRKHLEVFHSSVIP